jgi:hypothetical protein
LLELASALLIECLEIVSLILCSGITKPVAFLAPSHSNTKERISLKEGRFIMNRVDSPTSKKNSSSNSSNTKKTKSSGRRDKLKSLMVERVIQKFKKKHGNVSLDGVALQFVSEQCEKIIMKGAGTENDLQRIVLEMGM